METNLFLVVVNSDQHQREELEALKDLKFLRQKYVQFDENADLLDHLTENTPDVLLICWDESNSWKGRTEYILQNTDAIPILIFGIPSDDASSEFMIAPRVWYSLEMKHVPDLKHILKNFLELKNAGFHRSINPLSARVRENYYNLIAENAMEGILIVQEGKLKYIDPQIRNFLGHDDRVLKSKNFIEFIHPQDQEMVMNMHQKRLSGIDNLEKYRFRVISGNGEYIWIESDGVLIHWDETRATLNFIRDINSQVAYEIQLGAVLEHFPVPLIQEDLSVVKDLLLNYHNQGVTDFHRFFNENPDDLHTCLQSIRISQCNQRSLQFFEVTDPAQLQALYSELLQGELINYRIRMLEAFWNGDTIFEKEILFKSGGGRSKTALFRSVILPGKEKTWDTILVSIIDLYERMQTDKQIRVLSQAIASSPVSVIITNINGDIEYVNPKFTEVSGYTMDEVYGKKPSLQKSGKTAQAVYDDLWQTISAGNEWTGEIQNKKKNGELYWERVSISPVKNEENVVTHFIAIKEDISERRQTETELLNAKLKAEEADRLKTAFLANMSHEIRTPMNAIVGFSEILRTSDVSGPEREEYFNIINNSCNTLSNLIDDIIDLAKIEAGQTKIAEDICKPHRVMKELQVYFEEEANKSGKPIKVIMETEIDQELIIKADEFRLRQVLSNLLGNAIKFTHKGFIHWGCSVQKQNFLRFYVKDTGIGIPESNLEIIFDRFRQMDGSSVRKYGGTGLGLTVSKSLVELMGGKIWVDSQVGRGSEFFFTLPYKVATADVDKKEPGTADRKDEFVWKNKTILVVEDNLSNFEFIKAVLSKTKAKILWAESGVKAIELFRKKNVDIVLMDIQIPEMDGYEATIRMKKLNDKIPVIAQTAYAMSQDREKALEVGCDDYISKPIKPLDLLNLMSRFL